MISRSWRVSPGSVQRLPAELHATVRVRERARLLRERRRRQDHVGERRRLRQEEVLHDEPVERASASRACCTSGSDIAGFSPMMYMPRISRRLPRS
jgi:hypothetical protein